MTTFTKISYSRGIGQELQARNVLQMPSLEALNRLSDKVAGEFGHIMPDPVTQGIDDNVTAKIASRMIEIQGTVQRNGIKLASGGGPRHTDLSSAIGDLLDAYSEKVANELVASIGSPMADAPNDLANAAAQDVNAAIDNARRPEGYAEGDMGIANFSEPQSARTGQEVDHPGQDIHKPGMTGGNSVVDASKTAAAAARLRQVLKKAADMGAQVGTPMADAPNDLANAAAQDVNAAIDNARRPEGYAEGGQGIANSPLPNGAEVGLDQERSDQDLSGGVSDNSVTKLSAARTQMISSVMEQLPLRMPTRDKMAAAVDLLELGDPDAQRLYMVDIYRQYPNA